MPKNVIKSFIKKTGKSEKELEKVWARATKEASAMGMEKDSSYVTEIFKTMLNIKESVDIKEFTKKFIESNKNFDNFYEVLTAGSIERGTLPDYVNFVTTRKRPDLDADFGDRSPKDNVSDNPELDSEEDEDDKGKEYNIVRPSPELKNKLGIKVIDRS